MVGVGVEEVAAAGSEEDVVDQVVVKCVKLWATRECDLVPLEVVVVAIVVHLEVLKEVVLVALVAVVVAVELAIMALLAHQALMLVRWQLPRNAFEESKFQLPPQNI